MSIPDTVGEHDITKGNAHFLSSLKYRGQLYSKVYGQATPSTIGQMTAALTTPIGKHVAGAWLKFKERWDMHKRKEVEEKTRESVLGRFAELKKETKEHPRTPVVPKKHRETELE